MDLVNFFIDSGKEIVRGGKTYWTWLGFLGVVILAGAISFGLQTYYGPLATTGLGEEIPWGIYIANFAFLVGVAAAAVMLVIPAYIFHQGDFKSAVILGESMAAAACITCVTFILATLGRPDRLWHIMPVIGGMNLPTSMLAWDVVVINGYLFLNLLIPFYILYTKYKGDEPKTKVYYPFVIIAIIFAIAIHTVTAFLFSSNVSRPFWNIAVLAPRFIASAFTSGPALIILVLQVIRAKTKFKIDDGLISTLAIVTTISLQINMFLMGSEIFTELYSLTQHTASIQYLFFGIEGHAKLVPWMWMSLAMSFTAVIILSIHPLREKRKLLNIACVLVIIAIWIEKGMGLVIPGFIPTPLGDIVEYLPTIYEVLTMFGIIGIGTLVFTILVKVAIPIELGELRIKKD